MVKDPPSTNTKPGPVSCPLYLGLANPPHFGLLYPWPVVLLTFLVVQALVATMAAIAQIQVRFFVNTVCILSY